MSLAEARYALFLAPREPQAFWAFGSAMLGYDAATGERCPQLAPDGVAAEAWARLTEEPRRYGFHATIKAPFRLAEGRSEGELVSAIGAFAAIRAPFALDLAATLLGGFIALTPRVTSLEASALEAAAVADFDHFRAPLSADERRRRQAAELTARQSALLERYGYPYVLDEFRLHFTLSGHAPAPFRDGLLRAIDALYARAVGSTPVVANGLSLFRQEDSTSRFRIVETFPFAQGASAAASTRGPVGVPAS